MASSLRRLLTFVKSPADFASMSIGRCGKLGLLGLDHRINGNFHGLRLRLRRLHKHIQPERKCARLHLIERSGRGVCFQLVAALRQVLLDECELAFLLRVPHDGFRNRSA